MLKISSTGLIALTFLSGKVCAANFGGLVDGSIQRKATVCMNVAAMASLTGLDNIDLKSISTDGEAGSIYTGQDVFHLESNTPVRVVVDNLQLNNGDYILNATYQIDGSEADLQTESLVTHNADHSISARVQLGGISEQLAGEYIGNITITVIPEPVNNGCG